MARKLSNYMKMFDKFKTKKQKALEIQERIKLKKETIERQRYEWRKGL